MGESRKPGNTVDIILNKLYNMLEGDRYNGTNSEVDQTKKIGEEK